jgi:hypothetical protein
VQGHNVYVLAKLMGHSDIAVLRRFLALVEDALQAAHARLGPVDHSGCEELAPVLLNGKLAEQDAENGAKDAPTNHRRRWRGNDFSADRGALWPLLARVEKPVVVVKGRLVARNLRVEVNL